MAVTTEFERAVEKSVGESVESIRQMPLDERRKKMEATRPLRFFSLFPFIGRGNVLRGRTLSRDKVEENLDEALR